MVGRNFQSLKMGLNIGKTLENSGQRLVECGVWGLSESLITRINGFHGEGGREASGERGCVNCDSWDPYRTGCPIALIIHSLDRSSLGWSIHPVAGQWGGRTSGGSVG